MERWRGIEYGWGGLVVVTELVSQTPIGMSKGQKDTSLSKVGVKSSGRGILGIWFGALLLETFMWVRLNVNTCSMIVVITEDEACAWVSATIVASSSSDLQRGWKVKRHSLTGCYAKFITVLLLIISVFSQNVKVLETLLTWKAQTKA